MNQEQLDIQPVKQTAVSVLITKLPSDVGNERTIKLQAGQASIKLLQYCVGWGVVNEPPTKPIHPNSIVYGKGDTIPDKDELMGVYNELLEEYEAIEEMYELLDATTLRQRRVVWVSHFVCKDTKDTSALIERILDIS